MKLQLSYAIFINFSSLVHHQIHQIHGSPSQIRGFPGLQTIWDLKVQPCYGCYGYGNGTRHGSLNIFATDSLFEGFGESLNWIAVRKQGTHCLQNQKCTALQKYKMQKPNLPPLSSKLVAFCQVIVIHRARCISRKPNRVLWHVHSFCQWANVGEPQEPKSDPNQIQTQQSCGNFGNVSQCPELQS